MTAAEWLSDAEAKLSNAGITSARLDCLVLLEHVTNQPREHWLAHPEALLDKATERQLASLINQRIQRVPLVHLTGRRQFFGLELEITPDVLTPRVETESMVEQAIKLAPANGRLLDVGTGSGAIAIAVAKNRPDLAVYAGDVSAKAMAVAKRNAKRHNVNINFAQSDLLAAFSGRFDVFTANLPYLQNDAELMPEVKAEPGVALFGGSDGLDLYRQFFKQAPGLLSSGGLVLIEADPWQHDQLAKLAEAVGFKQVQADYFIVTLKYLPK